MLYFKNSDWLPGRKFDYDPCRFRMSTARGSINLLFLVTQVRKCNIYLFVFYLENIIAWSKFVNPLFICLKTDWQIATGEVWEHSLVMSKSIFIKMVSVKLSQQCYVLYLFIYSVYYTRFSEPLISWVNVSACSGEFLHGEVLCLQDLLHI